MLGLRVGDKTSFNESTDGTVTMRNANAQALESLRKSIEDAADGNGNACHMPAHQPCMGRRWAGQRMAAPSAPGTAAPDTRTPRQSVLPSLIKSKVPTAKAAPTMAKAANMPQSSSVSPSSSTRTQITSV